MGRAEHHDPLPHMPRKRTASALASARGRRMRDPVLNGLDQVLQMTVKY